MRPQVEIAAPAVLVGHDVAVAVGTVSRDDGDGNLEERGGAEVAGFAPVEARVRDDDFAAGDEQARKEMTVSQWVMRTSAVCRRAACNWGEEVTDTRRG